jgi:hypothetical protein
MKTDIGMSTNVRQVTVSITDADANDVDLFDLPANTRLLGLVVGVSDAFNTSAKLAIGVKGTGNDLVAAQAIDAVGSFFVDMAKPYKTGDQPSTIVATVSDKSAVGACTVTALIALDIDVKF